jgi:septum formation protein
LQVLVLASGSSYRAELLRRLGLPFTQVSPDIDETAWADESPPALAQRLAREKALAVRGIADCPADALVIASDQVAALGHRRLHKPGSTDLACAQLASMSGQTVEFITALHLLNTATGQRFEAVDRTVARLRELGSDEIERYVKRERPLDCAGSFKVEALGISLFASVSSEDPTALIGLPLIALCNGLRRFGRSVP